MRRKKLISRCRDWQPDSVEPLVDHGLFRGGDAAITVSPGLTHSTGRGLNLDKAIVPYFMERFRDAYTNQLQDFAKNVLQGAAPPITIDDGLEALRIGVAATRARESGARVEVASVKS